MARTRPRGRMPAVLITALLVVGACTAYLNAAEPTDPPVDRSIGSSWTAPTQVPEPTATVRPPESTPEPTFAPTGVTESAEVLRVVDGDTIEVRVDGSVEKVRYIGIDTPETVDPNSELEWMGTEASAANTALVDGRDVVLERDVSEVDSFDRLLRYVWFRDGDEWTLVNAELVRLGFAAIATYPPDVKYVDLFLEAQRDAQAQAVGLWGAPPTPEPTPSPTPSPTPTPTPSPTPTPKPTPAAVTAISSDPVYIVPGARERWSGSAGNYSWEDVTFEESRVTVRWSVSAADSSECRLWLRLRNDSGTYASHKVNLAAGTSESDNSRDRVPRSGGEFAVRTTCPSWKVSMQGVEPPPPPPPPAPRSGGGGGGGGGSSSGGSCHPSYRGACLKVGAGDYDCASGSGNGPNYTGTVSVVGPDEFDLDRDGDGVGCEDG